MRISDWSSDGCSSDLIAIAGGHSGGRGHGKQCGWPPSRGPLQAENEDMSLSDVAIRNAKPRAKPYKMGDSLGLFLLVQPSGGRLWRLIYRLEIGRASCRERVCQYVSITVVAVALT